MGNRIDLQSIFENILGSDQVYFQPPPTVQMTYPAIVYRLNNIKTSFSANFPYRHIRSYMVSLMVFDPDTTLVGDIMQLQSCVFDRHYAADGLNHYIFVISY